MSLSITCLTTATLASAHLFLKCAISSQECCRAPAAKPPLLALRAMAPCVYIARHDGESE
jgi:hypothetical protein